MICANPLCSKEFTPMYHDQVFCCRKCRLKSKLQRAHNEREAMLLPILCAWPSCHKPFIPHKGARYCSPECRTKGLRASKNRRNATYRALHPGSHPKTAQPTARMYIGLRYEEYVRAVVDQIT